MVTPVEIGLLLAVVAAVALAYLVLRAVKPFIVNAVVGLIVLLIAGFFGFGVKITAIVVLVVAVGGVPGALLVLILAHVDVVFETAMLSVPF